LVPYLADALVLLGLFVMTVGVYGAIRMPDAYTKLHAMSKAVFLGVMSFCASSAVTGNADILFRAILIAAFLLVTTPISVFVIARRPAARGEDGYPRSPGRVRQGPDQVPGPLRRRTPRVSGTSWRPRTTWWIS
jgi:multicomponent Na+:H+ antiporter subunit G